MIRDLSIYIHIPFCDSKCYYCNFISCVSKNKKEYFSALKNEISEFKNSENYIVKSIYIGGGTPSSVESELIEKILNKIRRKFKITENPEISIECNPNSVDMKKLKKYKGIGINRISFGVQSFNKKSLEFIGRVQEKSKLKSYKKSVINTLKQAKEIGFKNISADLMLGLPYQKNSHIKKLAKKLSNYVQHFSCYMLSVEGGTKLFELLPQGVSEEILSRQYELTVRTLKNLGFERYEISNFAKKGFESKHNSVYWSMGEYVGFGVASHSFLDGKRIANTENIKKYISYYCKLEDKETRNKSLGDSEVRVVEKLTKEQLAEETIMLSLRTRKGLDLIAFRNNFYDLEKKKARILASLLNNGFIKFENNFLRLLSKGILVSNAIILEIIA